MVLPLKEYELDTCLCALHLLTCLDEMHYFGNTSKPNLSDEKLLIGSLLVRCVVNSSNLLLYSWVNSRDGTRGSGPARILKPKQAKHKIWQLQLQSVFGISANYQWDIASTFPKGKGFCVPRQTRAVKVSKRGDPDSGKGISTP